MYNNTVRSKLNHIDKSNVIPVCVVVVKTGTVVIKNEKKRKKETKQKSISEIKIVSVLFTSLIIWWIFK